MLRRIIGCDLDGVDIALRSSVFAQAFDHQFLMACDHRYLLKLYNLLDNDAEKGRFLNTIKQVARECLYTEFHYAILGAKAKGLPVDFEDEITARIAELRFAV